MTTMRECILTFRHAQEVLQQHIGMSSWWMKHVPDKSQLH
jgi:hypothetical protein